MTYSPTHQSHRDRQSRQAYSCIPSPAQQRFDGAQDLQPTSRIYHASSPRLPGKASQNLRSLVSRFEALDALSLPFAQPIPLQVSYIPRHTSRHQVDTERSPRRKHSTIFSPKTETETARVLSSSKFGTARGGVFTSLESSKLYSSLRKLRLGRIETPINVSYQPSSIKLRGGVWDLDQSLSRKTSQTDIRNDEQGKGKKAMRDMISLYDGALSRGIHTDAKSCTATITTPTDKIISPYTRNQLTTSTGSARQRIIASHIPQPVTPTRAFLSSVRCQQNSVFGSPVRNPFATPSPTKSSMISAISPRSLAKPHTKVPVLVSKLDSPPKRRNDLHQSPSETARKAPPEEIRGRGKASAAEERPATFNKRKFSDQIEMLYRAKSLERRLEIEKDEQKQTSAYISLPMPQPFPSQKADPALRIMSKKPIEIKKSRVADMRKIFDRGTSSKSSIAVQGPNTSKPNFSVVEVTDNIAPAHAISPEPPSSPPPAYSLKHKRSSNISPRTLFNLPPSMTNNHIEPAEETSAFTRLFVAPKRVSPPKSKAIGDKIKLFEGIYEEDKAANIPEKKRKSLTRKLNRSLKGLFEPSALRKSEDDKENEMEKSKVSGKKRGMTGKEIQDIINEFQDTDTHSPKVWKQRRLNAGARKPLVIGQDGTHSEKEFGSPNSLEVSEMIVKEAECGLKQPKPLRVVEMKRMMALCRDRFGSIRYREKGSITTRKL